MEPRQKVTPHPTDGCDEDKCYEVMMTERTVLITARRESEDNLIKTIITLSSTLIALIAGFITQFKEEIVGASFTVYVFTIIGFGAAISAGLLEQFFSSKAYSEQQSMLEDYYGKYIDSFTEAPSNRWVRIAQVCSLISFVVALVLISVFAIIQAGEKHNVGQTATTPASSTSTSTTTAASPSSAAATAIAGPGPTGRGQRLPVDHKISRSHHATAPS